ncbi:hypothetical protein BST81_03040 [Leptolyngbya sp. 'hensonii']|uniref:hypothetical protein n=1 Tax=Leptolyngbya sp. 'hensonii' TaxID=1922337 RepID=UPI00094F4ED7|nr:hypothetical protein [Leptolyngbya sp. 'hensonii']OLP19883.1 hypothetical protein BST81_03040 [Leptolyngbya sp. 'hensonii']
MSQHEFHDGPSLAEAAEQLGKKAVRLGLIHSLYIHYFADSSEFYIPNDKEGTALTPEEAYMQLKKLITKAENS